MSDLYTDNFKYNYFGEDNLLEGLPEAALELRAVYDLLGKKRAGPTTKPKHGDRLRYRRLENLALEDLPNLANNIKHAIVEYTTDLSLIDSMGYMVKDYLSKYLDESRPDPKTGRPLEFTYREQVMSIFDGLEIAYVNNTRHQAFINATKAMTNDIGGKLARGEFVEPDVRLVYYVSGVISAVNSLNIQCEGLKKIKDPDLRQDMLQGVLVGTAELYKSARNIYRLPMSSKVAKKAWKIQQIVDRLRSILEFVLDNNPIKRFGELLNGTKKRGMPATKGKAPLPLKMNAKANIEDLGKVSDFSKHNFQQPLPIKLTR